MHAAHERILYEQLKNDYSGDGIKSQPLLLPVCFSLNDQQLECIETNALFFEQLGFRAQQIGQNQLQVTHMPMLLKDSPIAELLEKTIDEFIEHKETINEAVNQILSTMACHSAIRHGRRLSNDEMNLLLRQIEKTEKSNYCNHGRPTWKCLNMKELDRMFKRGQ